MAKSNTESVRIQFMLRNSPPEAQIRSASSLRSSQRIGNRRHGPVDCNLQIGIENDRDRSLVDFPDKTDMLRADRNLLACTAFFEEANSVWHGESFEPVSEANNVSAAAAG